MEGLAIIMLVTAAFAGFVIWREGVENKTKAPPPWLVGSAVAVFAGLVGAVATFLLGKRGETPTPPPAPPGTTPGEVGATILAEQHEEQQGTIAEAATASDPETRVNDLADLGNARKRKGKKP